MRDKITLPYGPTDDVYFAVQCGKITSSTCPAKKSTVFDIAVHSISPRNSPAVWSFRGRRNQRIKQKKALLDSGGYHTVTEMFPLFSIPFAEE